MTEPTNPNPAPGWYADPWRAADWRYFDGVAWTAHTSGGATPTQPSAQFDPKTSASGARMGRAAILLHSISMLGSALSFMLLAAGFGSIPASADTTPASSIVLIVFGFILVSIMNFVPYGVLVLIIMWSYRIARDGQILGVPARRTPGWAIGGWFIPIVSLWFPYESICDAVPAERRPKVLRWWLLYVFGSLVIVVPGVTALVPAILTHNAFIGLLGGLIGCVPIAVMAYLQRVWGNEVADGIAAVQQEIAGVPATTPHSA